MSLMSFPHFVTACITLVFCRSNLVALPKQPSDYSIKKNRVPQNVKDLVAEHGHHFEALFSEFFFFVELQTIELDKLNEELNRYCYAICGTLYDRMYENFSDFVDFALNNMIVVDVNTLYAGMSTQLKKFQKGYEVAYANDDDRPFGYGRVFSFSSIAAETDYYYYYQYCYDEIMDNEYS